MFSFLRILHVDSIVATSVAIPPTVNEEGSLCPSSIWCWLFCHYDLGKMKSQSYFSLHFPNYQGQGHFGSFQTLLFPLWRTLFRFHAYFLNGSFVFIFRVCFVLTLIFVVFVYSGYQSPIRCIAAKTLSYSMAFSSLIVSKYTEAFQSVRSQFSLVGQNSWENEILFRIVRPCPLYVVGFCLFSLLAKTNEFLTEPGFLKVCSFCKQSPKIQPGSKKKNESHFITFLRVSKERFLLQFVLL